METDRRTELLGLLSNLNPRFCTESGVRLVAIRIAGVRVDFFTPSEALQRRLQEYFASYLADPRPGETPQGMIYAETRASHALWEDVDPEFDLRGPQVIQRDFAARRVAPPDGIDGATALLAPDLDDAIHNLFRWFLPPLLLRNGAFLLHGAGVIRDQQGYVFFGHSEAGKSTSVSLIAESDPRATILGDDGILIQMRSLGNGREEPFVLAAPLGCGYSRSAPPPLAAPLRGLYALKQDDSNWIERLPASEGVAQLLASVMCSDFEVDTMEEKIRLACRFAASGTRIGRLHFRKTSAFWPLVRGGRSHEEHPHVGPA